jgi:5-hydroxyisourate hydrolase
MSPITTHVLDTARGRPARGVPVQLERLEDTSPPQVVGMGTTDDDGRLSDLLADDASLEAGFYRIRFDTAAYFETQNVKGFYPEVVITFQIRDPGEHYHVPLLISPFGYSTYRGS